MQVKLRTYCAILVVGTLALGSAWASITVSFNPVDSAITSLGGTALVDIVADIPEEDAILTWGLDLDVANPAIADWTLDSIGGLFTPIGSPDGDDLGGLVPQPGNVWGTDILLATVEFTGFQYGVTAIDLSDDNPPDLTEGFGLDPSGFADVIYGSGTVTVTPEPSALSLMALAGLAILRRR